ncbi:dipeptidyl peptidase 3-like [Sycon ciliatum]|uniref:dipeptidyl peptidase 3-like n=1 Tax=Sycon ciliatum TaxID=27933 RepID=UPI0031F6AF76
MSAHIPTPVSVLDCSQAFELLHDSEKLYAHYVAEASFNGGLIVLLQTSPESPLVFVLLRKLFSVESQASLKASCTEGDDGVSTGDFELFLEYAAVFFSNMGNYKSFGDSKIVPDITEDKFWLIISKSKAFAQDKDEVQRLWDACHCAIFDMSPRRRQLGLGDKGLTTYYSSNCATSDAELIQTFMQSEDLSPYNTRVFKTVDGASKVTYELRLASAVTSGEQAGPDDDMHAKLKSYEYNGVQINVVRGDYAPLMQRVVDSLTKAKEYAANENEVLALTGYINSFQCGSIPWHKQGSRSWIADKGPVVESYIGFIESYRDPFGVRGEFEGFVAVVDKAKSAQFGQLVEMAPQLLPMLPWPATFEKDTFLRPDFTSLDVLAFGGSGIPAGINIPNYDDIRQSEGFKNVSLGNVLSARTADGKITFVHDDDQELVKALKAPSFDVQVGLHELLGHGSGKHFQKDAEGKFNFDIDSVIDPLTNEKVKTWYGPLDTWDTKFSTMSSSYEECRAECVGIYLCLDKDILKIFGHEGRAASDILYVNWLLMVRAGLCALEVYTPETESWRQAHMQARHAILRVLLEAHPDIVRIEKVTGEDGKPDVVVRLDRSLIYLLGKPAIAAFLQKLQVYKSTADVDAARGMYNHYTGFPSEVQQFWYEIRNIVLARKKPRQVFVQAHTTAEDNGTVKLQNFEPTTAGMVESWVSRFPDACATELLALAKTDEQHWKNF